MKYLIFAFMLGTISCARHHEKSAHHHHHEDSKTSNDKFQGVCAESLAEGDSHVMGKREYALEHAGQMYYFSSASKKALFEENLTENIKKAELNWERSK